MSQKNQSSVFIITGMHRSGTSLAASLMQSAGVNIGERLLGATCHNQKGHFENLDFLAFHEAALRFQGVSQEGWTLQEDIRLPKAFLEKAKEIIAKNETPDCWSWKDPRSVLFLNCWESLLPQAHFIFVYRSPWKVIDSLYRRGDTTFRDNPYFALQVWLHYNKLILKFYRQFEGKSILLNCEDILTDYTVISDLCKKKFGIQLGDPSRNIIDKSLMKSLAIGSHRQMLIRTLFPEAVELYRELNNQADLKGQSDLLDESEVRLSAQNCVFQDWLETYRIREHCKIELEQFQTQIQNLNEAHKHEIQKLDEHYQDKFNFIHLQFQETHAEWQHSQDVIQAMQTSKFWKLRNAWFQFKRMIGLKSS